MNKEQIFNEFINYLNNDIQSKDFLTYQEQDEWKDYLERIINNYTKEKDKEIARLNKIIEEIEQWLKDNLYYYKTGSNVEKAVENYTYSKVLDRLQELKEEGKE